MYLFAAATSFRRVFVFVLITIFLIVIIQEEVNNETG
jgi:hypothetical protein